MGSRLSAGRGEATVGEGQEIPQCSGQGTKQAGKMRNDQLPQEMISLQPIAGAMQRLTLSPHLYRNTEITGYIQTDNM